MSTDHNPYPHCPVQADGIICRNTVYSVVYCVNKVERLNRPMLNFVEIGPTTNAELNAIRTPEGK